MRWKVQGGEFKLLETTEWNYESAGYNQYSSFPRDAGVSSDQKIWLFYSWQYGNTTLIWLEPAGEVIGISSLPSRRIALWLALTVKVFIYLRARA